MTKYGASKYGSFTYGILTPLGGPQPAVLVQNHVPALVSQVSMTGASAAVTVEARPGGFVVGALPSTPGDLFETAISLVGSSGTSTVDLLNSTWQTGEPEPNYRNAKTVWLHLPAQSSGILSVTSAEAAIGYWLEVFVGTSLSNLTLRGSGRFVPGSTSTVGGGPQPTGPITVTVPIAAVESVYIRVSPTDGGTQASFAINWSVAAIISVPVIQLSDTSIPRTPAAIQVSLTNATPSQPVTVLVQDSGSSSVASTIVTPDTMGQVYNASVILPSLAAGTYTVTLSGVSGVSPQSFTVVNSPYPTADSTAANSTPGAGTQPPNVIRWVLEDAAPNGLGVYTLPFNPESMTSPWPEAFIQTERTVAPGGVQMNWQGMGSGKDWQFKGKVLTAAHHDTLNAYAAIGRRIYITDHRSRTWIVAISGIEWRKTGKQADNYTWEYTVSAKVFGSLTSIPTTPTSDAGALLTGFDSNGVKLAAPTASVVGSTLTASGLVTTSRAVPFTLLQLVVTPALTGSAFSIGANPGTVNGTRTISGTGQLTSSGTWTVRLAYSLAPSPTDSDLIYGPAVQVSSASANTGAGSQPAATPGSSGSTLAGTGAASGAGVPTSNALGRKLVYYDDFIGSSLSSNWGVYDAVPSSSPAGLWRPNQVTVSNSKLVIRATHEGSRWVTGGVANYTQARQTYGGYEVRFRFPAATGIKYAFLLWPASGNWPVDGEIDFAEDGGGNRSNTTATLHYGVSNSIIQRDVATSLGSAWTSNFTQWHTVGVDWSPGLLQYTLDGKVWASVSTTDVPTKAMDLALQTEMNGPDGTTPETVDCEIDWVAVYGDQYAAPTVMVGASGDEAANGSYASWLGASIDIGASWSDTTLDDHLNAWGIQPGGSWGSWNKPIDFAVGGLYRSRGDTWAAAASGSYDSRWTQCINKCKSGWGTRPAEYFWFRPFHEFNLSSSDWNVSGADVANFKAAWIRFYNLKKSLWPASKLVFCPNDGTSGSLSLDWRNAFPGAQYCDAIGVDSYNQYPWANTDSAITTKFNSTGSYGEPLGLEKWRQYAASVGLPLAIPEWSNCGDVNGGGGGGESPLYVQRFHDWITANAGTGAGQVIYAIQFNLWTQFQFWPNTLQPQTAAKWKALVSA